MAQGWQGNVPAGSQHPSVAQGKKTQPSPSLLLYAKIQSRVKLWERDRIPCCTQTPSTHWGGSLLQLPKICPSTPTSLAESRSGRHQFLFPSRLSPHAVKHNWTGKKGDSGTADSPHSPSSSFRTCCWWLGRAQGPLLLTPIPNHPGWTHSPGCSLPLSPSQQARQSPAREKRLGKARLIKAGTYSRSHFLNAA